MDEREILTERLGRYKRFLDNEDARKTLEEADKWFSINCDIFTLLRTDKASGKDGLSISYEANVHEQIIAKEGARAYSQFLRALIETTETRLKMAEEIKEKTDE